MVGKAKVETTTEEGMILNGCMSEVRKRLDKVRLALSQGDSETAHSEEDKLYRWAMVRISGCTCVHEAQQISVAVLASRDIKFDRHCA